MRLDIDPDIRKASTPRSEFYLGSDAYEGVRQRVFARSWQLVTDAENLKVPGQSWPFVLLEGTLDEPLVATRDFDDKLHCLSNVCTHRGNIVCEGPGVERHLRCRYHGRRFGLDGMMTFMPEFDGCEGFPSEADNLAKIPFSQWSRFLFASYDPAAPLEEWLQPMEQRIGWLPIHEFTPEPAQNREYVVRGHWALYVDNYLEGFHIPYIHASLNDTLDYGQYSVELFRHGTLQLGVGKSGEDAFDLPKEHPDYGTAVSAYYFWIFPNLMFNFYPWGLSVNIVRPLAPDVTKVQFIRYVWKPDRVSLGAGAELDRVEREDEAVVEMVQKGLRSRFYDRGRYSPKRETGTHHFHRLLAEFLK